MGIICKKINDCDLVRVMREQLDEFIVTSCKCQDYEPLPPSINCRCIEIKLDGSPFKFNPTPLDRKHKHITVERDGIVYIFREDE